VSLSEKLTRRKLLQQTDWPEWEQAEFKQLDAYYAQGMFGAPVSPDSDFAIFHWVWVYNVKPHENNRKKARAVCDGSTRGGSSVVHGHTFAPTPDMVDFRLMVALAALNGLKIYCADVSNAFAEAPRPEQQYYMHVDAVFRNWWQQRFTDKPLNPRHVIPVCRNLQGHPEAPRQWSLHIDAILRQHLGFLPSTHAPCLYHGQCCGEVVYFLRQVDDFGFSCTDDVVYNTFCNSIDKYLSIPITRHGLLQHFNGLDVLQSSTFISVSVNKYLQQVLNTHGWTKVKVKQLPLRADNDYIKLLDTATPLTLTERAATETSRFKYRSCIGELIWPMVCARPDLAFPVVKLSQFSNAPAAIHFDAVQSIFQYLAGTADYALVYTRPTVLATCPPMPQPPCLTATNNNSLHHFDDNLHAVLHAYSDSDWAMDIRHRRSISGIVAKLAGGAVAWKCRVQPTVALSTTEAEFLAAGDAGRLTLYLRSVLADLQFPQASATIIFEDNRGALFMSQATQPTRHTRHIDIRHFALLNWVEQDLIVLKAIDTTVNPADLFTKQVPRILFHRHYDNISGCLALQQFHSS
jgi:hypothetical protein